MTTGVTTTSAQNPLAIAAAIAKTTLFTCGTTTRLLQCSEDDNQTQGKILGRLKAIEEQIEAYIQANAIDRVASMEAELLEVCEAGRKAQAERLAAKHDELIIRNDDEARSNAYNVASRALNNMRNAPLRNFYTQADLDGKNAAIAEAERNLAAVQADMDQHPLAIPSAVRRVQDAERQLGQLQARERELRRAIAAAKGVAASLPTVATESSTGLR